MHSGQTIFDLERMVARYQTAMHKEDVKPVLPQSSDEPIPEMWEMFSEIPSVEN